MNRIDHFAYDHDFLSNFYTVTVHLDSVAYASTEHAYQAAKTLDSKKRKKFQIEFNPTLTAAGAKRLGRKLKPIREDWENVKVGVMRDLLLQKFENPVLRRKLLATDDAELVEGNWWEDRYWGVCCGGLPDGFDGRKCRKWPHAPTGENILGKLLMEIRAEISNPVDKEG